MIPGPERTVESDLLFVYGTLRRGFRLHRHLRRLGARFLAEARVAAELFDLGLYPGARPVVGTGKWVSGELFQLRQPKRDLEVLDQVEGFVPDAPERSEFVRATVEILPSNGTRRRAWIYWLGTKVGPARRIASGDYAEWVARAD
jgi:gamma-glutamylcyclotransferase (GGCT)/AIG2-like uncharacterized protein YtfP